MLPDFGELLHQRLEQIDLTQQAFAEAVGVSTALVSLVRSGRRKPPLDQFDDWCRVLDLSGHERQRFVDLACMCHLPDRARQRFASLLVRCERLERRVAELEEGYDARPPKGRRSSG